MNRSVSYPAESHPHLTAHQLSKGSPVTLTAQGVWEDTVKWITESREGFYSAATSTLATSTENVNTGRQELGSCLLGTFKSYKAQHKSKRQHSLMGSIWLPKKQPDECGKCPAAAAAKSLQSCPTLCDPIDGSSPGSAIPGILQARTPEWVAISSSNALKWKVKSLSLAHPQIQPGGQSGTATAWGHSYLRAALCGYHWAMSADPGRCCQAPTIFLVLSPDPCELPPYLFIGNAPLEYSTTTAVLSHTVASAVWLLSPRNVTTATEELHFQFLFNFQ